MIDYFLFAPLLFGLYKGWTAGLIRELIGFISIVIALIISHSFREPLLNWLVERTGEDSSGMGVLSYSLLFIGTLIVLNLLARLLTKVTHGAQLETLNRLGGALFSASKWLIILCLLTRLFFYINDQFHWVESALIEDSFMLPFLNQLGAFLVQSAQENIPNSISV